MQDPTFIDTLKIAVAASVVWLGGEGGRVLIAGGMGGLTRWFYGEKRLVRDGVLAVVGGALAARYLWPVPLHLLGTITGPLERSPENISMAAFLAGALGMSFVKVLTAMIEARARKGGEDA